jgi:hypothetical protein
VARIRRYREQGFLPRAHLGLGDPVPGTSLVRAEHEGLDVLTEGVIQKAVLGGLIDDHPCV